MRKGLSRKRKKRINKVVGGLIGPAYGAIDGVMLSYIFLIDAPISILFSKDMSAKQKAASLPMIILLTALVSPVISASSFAANTFTATRSGYQRGATRLIDEFELPRIPVYQFFSMHPDDITRRFDAAVSDCVFSTKH